MSANEELSTVIVAEHRQVEMDPSRLVDWECSCGVIGVGVAHDVHVGRVLARAGRDTTTQGEQQ